MELGSGGPFTAPDSIGPYRILGTLGRGGMGMVYRAHDPRLKRDVAVKVLHAEAGSRPRPERFLDEARAAGAIQHPHLVAVYDVDPDGHPPYLVTELIDGHPLRQELDRGPLPVPRVLELATQIADGLAAAHRAGFVHRDLKPDNVMITRDGRVKIVDFGLATSAPSPPGRESVDLTETARLVVGTAAYMSPEQARGGPVDFRSDQFALGVLLYEMLTGRRAFDRPSAVETLAAILHDEPPPLTDLNPRVPANLARIVGRCLAKAREDRYAATVDLWHDLRAVNDRSQAAPGARHAAPGVSRHLRGGAVVVALVVGLAGGAAVREFIDGPAAAPPVWLLLTSGRGLVAAARFATDGQSVVYSAAWNGEPFRVFTTTLSSPESRALDLPPAGLLAVSPTGELALSLDCTFVISNGACAGTLARAPLLGGAPRAVAEGVRTADWGGGGALASVIRDDGAVRNDAWMSTDPPFRVEWPPLGVLSTRGGGHVRVSPDGTRVAWSELNGDGLGADRIIVRDAAGQRTLSHDWTFISGLAWAADGRSLYVSGLGAASRDDTVLRVSLDGVAEVALRSAGRIRVLDAAAGRLLVAQDESFRLLTAFRADQGWTARDITWLSDATIDALSHDGQTALFTLRVRTLRSGNRLFPIYAQSTDGGSPASIGIGYGLDISPDGRLALTRTRPVTGQAHLVIVPLGPGEPRTLPRGAVDSGVANSRAVFVGSDRILLRGREGDGPWRSYLQDLAGGPPRPVDHDPGVVASPVAPDGEWFISERADGTKWITSIAGAESRPAPSTITGADRILQWSTNGDRLWVARPAGPLMQLASIDVATGRRIPIRDIPPADTTAYRQPEFQRVFISRDGSRVLRGDAYARGRLYLVEGVR